MKQRDQKYEVALSEEQRYTLHQLISSGQAPRKREMSPLDASGLLREPLLRESTTEPLANLSNRCRRRTSLT